VLLNLLSFLIETSSGGSYYSYGGSDMASTIAAAKAYKCSDCGHTHDKPQPSLPSLKDTSHKVVKYDEITCYATRLNIEDAKNDVFGFGIIRSGNDRNPNYASPCEYITEEGFNTLKANGKVESVMREVVDEFIPLYINPIHAKNIQKVFEQSIVNIGGKGHRFDISYILNVIPKLMNSAVVSFMNGTTHASERALHGYFAFHRLFIWAVGEYDLSKRIDDKIEQFINDQNARLKSNTPNIGDWLTYLTVSTKFGWEHASIAYIKENMLRNVMWFLKEQPSLARVSDAKVNATRLDDTFRLTKVSRDLLAFQVLFLDIARPKELSLKEVAERYDNNYGLPTEQMENDMKSAVAKIKTVANYPEFFKIIKVPTPPKEKFMEMLISSINTAGTTDGYYQKDGGGRGGGGRGGGGGGGGRGGGRGRDFR